MLCACRIVEVRSCTTGPANVVDWAGNHDSVVVTGNVFFQGNMVLKGKQQQETAFVTGPGKLAF